MQLDVAGSSKNFVVDTGAPYSVLASYLGAFFSQTCTILGAIGKTIAKRLTQALLCFWDGHIFSHQFLVVPECPTPLLGRDILTVLDFIFLGSKITADGDCSHEIKKCLLLRRKVMTNLGSIFKSRDITLPTKFRLVKAMVFSCGHVWM